MKVSIPLFATLAPFVSATSSSTASISSATVQPSPVTTFTSHELRPAATSAEDLFLPESIFCGPRLTLSTLSTRTTTALSTTSATNISVVASSPTATNLSPNAQAPSRLFRRKPNGCGPEHFGWMFKEYKFHDCCNQHDACWGTCDMLEYQKCNDRFLACMNEVCSGGMYYDEHIKCYKKAIKYHKWVVNWAGRLLKMLDGRC